MKKLAFTLLASVLLISCGGSEESTDSEQNEDGNTDTTSQVEVEEIPIDISLNKILEFPDECEVQGNVVDAYRWNDKNGHNYFIRTINEIEWNDNPNDEAYQTGTQYLWAYHYTEDKDGKFTLLKETTDFVKDCEMDLIMGHELDAITLTDLDEDEIGEIAFIYRLTCTSDVSPSTQKLIMLEDGQKYPLRGNTEVMGMGGEYEVGDEFKSAPESFLEHAKTLWSEHLVEYDFDL